MYEIQITYVIRDKKGNDKTIKSSLILENAESFADAEQIGYDYGSNLTAIDVVAIKRSKLREIVNKRQNEEEKIFFATIIDKFYDADKDETTETPYVVALHAHDINEAHKAIDQYMKQGMEDMELVGLKCTKYISVL